MMGDLVKSRWEHFAHKADIGIRGIGATKEQAFEQAAVAMTAVIARLEEIEPREKVQINCEAGDDELLLADWLNSLLYEMDTRKMLFGRFEVRIESGRLSGAAWGEKMDVARHDPAVEVKAATYTMLSVREDSKGCWTAQCIVDV